MSLEEERSQTEERAPIPSTSYNVAVTKLQHLAGQNVLREKLRRSKEDILKAEEDIQKDELGIRWPKVDTDVKAEDGEREQSENSYDLAFKELLRQNQEKQRVLKERLRKSKEDILKVREDIRKEEAVGWGWPRVDDVDVEQFLREREVEAGAEDGERQGGKESRGEERKIGDEPREGEEGDLGREEIR